MSRFIYLCGPIDGLPVADAKARFEVHAALVREQTDIPMTPLGCGVDATAPLLEQVRKSIPTMLGCEEVHLLDGWQNCSRARLERDVAVRAKMTVVYIH